MRRVHLVAGLLRRLAEALDDLQPHHLRDVRRLDVGQRAVRLRSNYFLRGGSAAAWSMKPSSRMRRST